jgi:choline dehydrogenase-like flavoprotein
MDRDGRGRKGWGRHTTTSSWARARPGACSRTGRAVGIEAQTSGTISARETSREVILSAGAINSPQLLLHVTANLNAPVIMIAEKLADAILGKSSLPRSSRGEKIDG